METVFKYNKKIKPLVKINDFKFVDYHNLQPSICYYIRKYDEHNNYDLVEAKIQRTKNVIKDRYTLGAGTSIKVIDSFMYSYLRHRNEKLDYKTFINLALKESNLNTDYYKNRYNNSSIPAEFKRTTKWHNLLSDKYSVLYVLSSEKNQALKQHYIVFVKETNEKVLNETISYITFKPVQLIVKMDYLKGKTTSKYHVNELPEINIPTSILK